MIRSFSYFFAITLKFKITECDLLILNQKKLLILSYFSQIKLLKNYENHKLKNNTKKTIIIYKDRSLYFFAQ